MLIIAKNGHFKMSLKNAGTVSQNNVVDKVYVRAVLKVTW